MNTAERLSKVPPYIFVELDQMRKAAVERGEDVISLSIGDPDLPTPSIIVDALAEAAKKPENHCYPLGKGKPELLEEISRYYAQQHDVRVDPYEEIVALIGSKEGIGHLPLAIVNPGDVVLYPDPGYPVYWISAHFAEAEPVPLALRPENDFLPDLEAVPSDILHRTRLLWINYPNNPTASVAPLEFFEKVVWFAKKYGFVVAHDAAYLDLVFHGHTAYSFLAVKGAKEVGIEFHSFSKTFHMTGWRLGFAAGNSRVVGALAALKANLDSGVFGAIQDAGIVAMKNFDKIVPELVAVYEQRCQVLTTALTNIGWRPAAKPRGTFYVWLPTLHQRSSMDMTKELLQRCAVMVTPGTAFGNEGEGFVRISLTAPEPRIKEAVRRIERANII
ncbi:MAG: LL-diaminopimelate aminotransferase [Candidatus Sumerlaeaceae bacterium]|nr:LL-diaminopimelate aminotransferase [Candidatus Sumerlaeaceae bacterium]